MVKKAIILCGGLATRFLPYTKSVPKEMLPILDRPSIDYTIEDLKSNGITDILIVLGRNKECLETYYDRNVEMEERLTKDGKLKELRKITDMLSGVNLYFKRQLFAKGTGYAVSICKEFVGNEPFMIMYPDEIMLNKSFSGQLLEFYNKSKMSVIPLKKIDIKESKKYGMAAVMTDSLGLRITGFAEKPEPKDSPSNLCSLGGGIFTPELFDCLKDCKPQPNGEIYLTDAYNKLIENKKLYGQEIGGLRLDVGNKLGFVKGNILAGLSDPEIADELKAFIKEISPKI